MDSSNPVLNQDQGFVSKPYARKKVIRKADGTTQVVYEDVRTGKVVNPQGYTVIQSDNNISTVTAPTQGQTLAKPSNQDNQDKTATEEILASHGKDSVSADTTSQAGASYYNKPGWMGFTSMLPGPIGAVAKLGNLGVNASNTSAVNDQREALGFAPNSTAKNIGSSLFDQNGYIGDLSTTKTDGTVSTAPVSFEATDKNQRTAYTPDEARMHEQLAGSKPATDPEVQGAIGTFNNKFPEQKPSGFLSGLTTAAKGLFGGIFGSSNPTPTTGSGIYTGGQTPSVDSHGFPSKPDAPTNGIGSPDDRDHTTNGGYDHPGLF